MGEQPHHPNIEKGPTEADQVKLKESSQPMEDGPPALGFIGKCPKLIPYKIVRDRALHSNNSRMEIISSVDLCQNPENPEVDKDARKAH